MLTKATVQRVCRIALLGALTLTLSGVIGVLAQDDTPTAAPPVPLRVEVQAADGLMLVGDLYNAELSVQTPALLLMHMYRRAAHRLAAVDPGADRCGLPRDRCRSARSRRDRRQQ